MQLLGVYWSAVLLYKSTWIDFDNNIFMYGSRYKCMWKSCICISSTSYTQEHVSLNVYPKNSLKDLRVWILQRLNLFP